MAKTNSDGDANESAPGPTEGADHPVLGDPGFHKDWTDRLCVAREQRSLALAARAQENGQKQPETGAHANRRASERKPRPGNAPKENQNNGKLMLVVFSASAGVGLGVTLGIGILLVWSVVAFSDVAASLKAEQGVGVALAALPSETPQPAGSDAQGQTTDELVTFVSVPVAAPDVWIAPEGIVAFEDQPTTYALKLPDMTGERYELMSFVTPARPDFRPPAEDRADPFLKSSANENLPKFFMHAPDGLSEDKVRGLVAQLEQAGASVAGVGRESFRVSETHLRYYSPETAEAAMAIARDLDIEARDFSLVAQNTSRIEVWVAGRPKSSSQADNAPRGLLARLFGPPPDQPRRSFSSSR
ncbi:MAG: hypothetical protein AAF665_16120 [Pseudomonadota bacterium]